MTKSQQLRYALFMYYSNKNITDVTFEEFYSQTMDKVIKQVKERC